MPKPIRTRVGRTRTFTGCRTCRRRHTKCDEGKPSCRVCQQSGLVCGGYAARLLWATQDVAETQEQQSDDTSKLRYPLFSDAERQVMSEGLLESLGSQLAEDVLVDLDSASKKIPKHRTFSVSKGPFGAFQLSKDQSTLMTPSPPSTTSSDCIVVHGDDPDTEPPKECTDEWTQQLNEMDFDPLGDSLDLALELISQGEPGVAPTTFSDSLPDLFVDFGAEASLFSSEDVTGDIANIRESIDAGSREQNGSLNALLRESSPSPSGTNLPEQASSLLRYYKSRIEEATTALKAKRKSPWELVFLPCAFQTFAELSLLGNASHTRATILYALLARSAFQLDKSTSNQNADGYWWVVGKRHLDKARCHVKNVLELEMSGSRQAEYEELLMAFLAMAVTSFSHGGRAAQNFLLDAERLIRVRGLIDQKPQKTRLLHHLYTYLRLIAESISTFTSFNSRGQPDGFLVPPSSQTFRVSEESLNVGLDPTIEKTAQLGYSDIHLEVQGLWAETLHSTIHGIPESLMTLLSQTTSLANEKEYLESRARCDAKVSADLKRHVKTLEKRIWSWNLTSEFSINSKLYTEQELIHHPQTQSMVLAIHRALVIHFYRRIHDISAMILQDIVRETLEHLEPCMEKMVEDEDFTPSLAWAAFIAASEAIIPELQERALKCVSITENKGFYCTSMPSTEVITAIWAER
ncbi:ARG81-transcription factor involved in arginine metabolism [Fusarium albosuccineum]|uniref:ARG81-transcription factor involved in arginine metabolism n=1 Tax=Fusarium albosuccineum TaxID=1237068 RepID=A0A8H4PEN8_9HYPO|nr:ARG81-transcription factor involved in arginine metabolism [Fusarium albosuccineum]